MPTKPRVAAIIPARWASSRFPGKPLADIRGKPMIQWVVEKAQKAEWVSEVLVATDDSKIFDAVSRFGGRVVMTSRSHISGTDRVAEAAAEISCDIVVNVQGDEPLIPPGNIDLAVEPMTRDDSISVSTLMTPIRSMEEVLNPNVTKTVADRNGFALYFSRSPIPFHRDRQMNGGAQGATDRQDGVLAFKHIGLYAYTRSFLMQFPNLPRSRLEEAEKLEQLRILENGIPIKITETPKDSVGVDCPADLEKIQQLMNEPVSG
ncbi:MAG: 3-deoxy-manno-octulosonate cytidylyltransferase [Nitrospinales bacterium]